MEQAIEREDPAEVEKKIDSEKSSISGRSPSEIEDVNSRLWLSEDEAYHEAKTHPEGTREIFITFSHDDKDNPRNYSKAKKWYITCFASSLNVLTCLCAGGYSSGVEQLVDEFGVSAEVGTVGLSMYILGFAIGPMLLAPLSEYFGRNPVYFCSWFVLFIFQLPLALAPNIGTVIVCRLIQGFGGSAPLTNTGGSVSDVWDRNASGPAMSIYGLSSTFGPPMALVISGYIALEKGWRWLFWVYMAIFGGVWLIMITTLPETRHSTILERKAARVRKQLKKEGFEKSAARVFDAHADESKSLHTLFAITLTRPFRFLFSEPITIGAAAYNGFIYGLVYLFNEAFPLVFGNNHGFNAGQQGLCFLGLAMGSVVGVALYPIQERYYLRKVAKNEGKGVPEARLFLARGGAFLLPISLFWFAWTSYSSVHWIVPIIASGFFGLGIYVVILSILNYVVDSYQTYSASALAGVILIRNLVGAGFPLFASQMYTKLGYEWASSLLAFLSILMIPIPWLWFYHGERLRLKSPWAREHFAQDEDSPH
ncbi:MFS general substrate transporter [Aureobasidium pullulans]|uniref:MFS general substrate transporter n=2 Tax=Aureobasidium pullulans TaxID=5580 RepID=A0A4S8ZSQ1_AURPU|nr:MFS general substrate transporter [Aureobasidium pullulans]